MYRCKMYRQCAFPFNSQTYTWFISPCTMAKLKLERLHASWLITSLTRSRNAHTNLNLIIWQHVTIFTTFLHNRLKSSDSRVELSYTHTLTAKIACLASWLLNSLFGNGCTNQASHLVTMAAIWREGEGLWVTVTWRHIRESQTWMRASTVRVIFSPKSKCLLCAGQMSIPTNHMNTPIICLVGEPPLLPQSTVL